MAYLDRDIKVHPRWDALTSDARAFILEAARAPARSVATGNYACVSGAFPSTKMGASIPYESRGGELSYAIHLEYSDDVLAYYDQAPLIDVQRTRVNGTSYATSYCADFLVVRRETFEVVQVKSGEKLQALLRSHPKDWMIDGDEFVDLAANRAFETLGLPHRVISTEQLNRYRCANYRLLLRCRASGAECSPELRRKIVKVLESKSVLRMSQLALSCGIQDLSPLLRLIDDGTIVANMDSALLAAPESCLISSESRLLHAAISEQQHSRSYCVGTCTIESAPAKHCAMRALTILERLTTEVPNGNTRRWNRRLREGEASGLSKFEALVPKWSKCGNRKPKRPPEVLAFAEHIVRQRIASPSRMSVHNGYTQYRLAAAEWHPGIAPVSKPTFRDISRNLRHEIALGRGGVRAANAAETPTDVELRVIKPLRPFETATCDHYLVDLSCVISRKGRKQHTKRPWFTVLRDVSTGDVLAYWISFARPSRSACACVLRSCLRRHGRLPEGIVVDHGAEFTSVYFRALLAHLEIELILRPTSHPKYGSEAERFFGILKTKWLSARPGNWANLGEIRGVSGSHRPEVVAQLDVFDLLTELNEFLEWHSKWGTAGDALSPLELMSQGLAKFPFSGRKIPYDYSFEVLTAVEVTKYSVDPSRGVKVGANWFWSRAIAQMGFRRRSVLVRKEPEDATVIYVLLADKWVRCLSSKAPVQGLLDPVHKLALAVVASGSTQSNSEVTEAAETELALLQRDADRRISNKYSANELDSAELNRDTSSTEESSADLESVWDRLRSGGISPLPASRWGHS